MDHNGLKMPPPLLITLTPEAGQLLICWWWWWEGETFVFCYLGVKKRSTILVNNARPQFLISLKQSLDLLLLSQFREALISQGIHLKTSETFVATKSASSIYYHPCCPSSPPQPLPVNLSSLGLCSGGPGPVPKINSKSTLPPV